VTRLVGPARSSRGNARVHDRSARATCLTVIDVALLVPQWMAAHTKTVGPPGWSGRSQRNVFTPVEPNVFVPADANTALADRSVPDES